LFCLFSASLHAQNRTKSGDVKDEEGTPLPGASIVVKGTSTGTESDFDGLFTLDIPQKENTVLVISSLGFITQEVEGGNKTTFSISLRTDVESLDEVVVVGYGTQKKKNLTGSVATIDSKVLESRPITDVGRGLQGVSPGLTITSSSGQIGQEPKITLRG